MKTKSTKLFYCALILISFAVGKVNAQMVYLPDTNFRNALIAEGYGAAIYGDSLDGGDSIIINASFLYIDSYGINDITGISAFVNLLNLICTDNQLTFLPQLPATLQYLNCRDNQLIFLPQLPSTLQSLYCARNLLTLLPSLPASLTELTCRENIITSLPVLPTGLYYLDCFDNQLTALPSLPPTLNYLLCQYN